jgi:photosystem II stability/assembly factor-like uncharacterized protein
MKLFIISFMIIIFCISCRKITDPITSSVWNLQYENEDNITYYSIYFTDENNGWIVGHLGKIKKTSDGGSTWKTQQSDVQSNLWDVCFINNQIGWVCGDSNTILYTIDSGNSWEKIIPSESNGKIYLSILFVDKNYGWTCNNNGEIFKSDNGGKNWILKKKLPLRGGTRLIVFDAETVYALQGKLFKTYDGGSSWDSVTISYPNYYTGSDMFFSDKENGWITTMNGTGGMMITNYPVVITRDGGNSWFSSEYVEEMGLTCCFFINENLGWIAGFDKVYKTTDGGMNWKLDFAPEHLGANEMFFLNENHGWILTWSGNIYKYN